MRQEEIEMLAFFYLCGKEDQNKLVKKGKMTFTDFQRFDYLTKRLEFWEYNKKIWKDFSEKFKSEFEFLETNISDEYEVFDEITEREKWWEKLLKNNKELLDSGSNYC